MTGAEEALSSLGTLLAVLGFLYFGSIDPGRRRRQRLRDQRRRER